MKRISTLILLLALAVGMTAKNVATKVTQVSESVTVSGEVDYTITGDEPFGALGSVDITTPEHAVVIIQKMKPSRVIASLMSHIFIEGVKASDGVNCQVRAYDRGAIILPYGKNYHPLTCYTGENFTGDSCATYTEGHTGGFMKTMTDAQLNNRVRSFRLKRGYMVTFALGKAGWGYSRVFIAHDQDLEIPVAPAPLYGKITSYRLFKWWYAHKAGLASDSRTAANAAVNSSWCYDWAQGNESTMPDVEWVPNHIYEDWPSPSSCGSRTGSCHMKTNNEPGNSADDHPQSVDVVLGNWQNLMRTGMRLCSETSHDGSWNHLRAFIDSIDARGWRCDLVDLHCYWGQGSFGDFSNYYNSYGGRPIWISEWVWGASWNSGNWSSGGIFAQAPDGPGSFSTANQQTCKNGTVPILQRLNASPYVERYAYWNSENVASKIYHNNQLSLLGQYYATMNEGIGYKENLQKVPTIVYKAPSKLKGTFDKKTQVMTMEWSDPNGDMIDSILIEVKMPDATRWTTRYNVPLHDMNGKEGEPYAVKDTIAEPGLYTYRVAYYVGKSRRYITNEVYCTLAASTATGDLQYGSLRVSDDESVSVELKPYDVAPYAVMGMPSYNNTSNALSLQVQTLTRTSMKLKFYPWAYPTPMTFDKYEKADYICLPPDTIFHITPDFMLISAKAGTIKGEDVRVDFPEAFPEGVTPIVVVQNINSITSYPPVVARVWDVTNTGFSVKLQRQEGDERTLSGQKVIYFAVTPGQVSVGGGKMLTAGRNDATGVGGSTNQFVTLLNEAGDTTYVHNPIVVAGAQTNNYGKMSVIRQGGLMSNDNGTYAIKVRRHVDATNTTVTETNSNKTNGDYIGWLIVSDDPNADAGDQPLIWTSIQGPAAGSITLPAYDLQGRPATSRSKGIVITGGKKVVR